MNYIFNQVDVIIYTLGWTLLHSLWQCLLLFAILKLVFAFIPQASARIKYILAYTALSGMFVWFVVTWMQQWQSLRATAAFVLSRISNTQISHQIVGDGINHSEINSNYLQSFLVKMENYMPLIVSMYCLGIAFMLLRFFVSIGKIRQLRRKGLTNVEQDWIEKTEQWVAGLSITRSVSIYISDRIHVPSAIGTLQPVILLPVTAFSHLSAEQLEAIILHELAHIKRYDYLLNIIQTVVETILFFNPFMWRVTAMIRQEREHCCDDLVVAYTKQPLCYAQALATIETYRTDTNTLALAAAGAKNQLFNRIKRIMEMKKHAISYSQIIMTVLFLCIFIATASWLGPTQAQTVKKTKKIIVKDINNGDTTTTTIASDKVIVEDHNRKTKKREDENKDEDKNEKGTAITIDYYILNDMDTVRIDEEIKHAMKKVDWDDIKESIKEHASTSMDSNLYYAMEKVKKEISQFAKKYQDSASAKSLEHVKKYKAINKKIIADYNNMTEEEIDSLVKHPAFIDKQHNRTEEYDKMIDEMDADKLLVKSKQYNIEKRMNNVLYINGVRQPNNVYLKYSKYFMPSKVMIEGKSNCNSITLIY